MLCHTAYPRSRRLCLGVIAMSAKQAIALCRVSTIGQLKDGNLDPQEERINKAADYLETEVIKWWRLAVSSRKGKNVNRKDLVQMYEFCKSHKQVKYLIVDEADRFMRSIDEYYFWKVNFKEIGVQLRHANRPEVNPEDQSAVFDELIDVYKGEQSNNERITKTPEKMQAKMRLGYYPGVVHHGYKKTDIKGLHEPLEPQWSLLRGAGRKILHEAYTLHDALNWLNKNGYEYGGRKLAMDKFKHIMSDPYNGGIITMSNWDTINETGLHKAMFTKDEHEQLLEIVKGKGKKFVVRKKENKFFGMNNVGVCDECLEKGVRATLVGYHHTNGKKGNSLKHYDRYRCRVCNKSRLKPLVHEKADQLFDSIEPIISKAESLRNDLKVAWREEMDDNTQVVARMKQRLNILYDKKDKLVISMASEPELAEDIKASILNLKAQIIVLENDIKSAETIDKDFEEFTDFAIDFVENMKQHFWDLDQLDKQRCKELIFPGEIAVTYSGKVYTHELSKVYRYKPTKKASQVQSEKLDFVNGGPGGT